jgi:hypothetical protein
MLPRRAASAVRNRRFRSPEQRHRRSARWLRGSRLPRRLPASRRRRGSSCSVPDQRFANGVHMLAVVGQNPYRPQIFRTKQTRQRLRLLTDIVNFYPGPDPDKEIKMRLVCFLAIACGLAASVPALAQQSGRRLDAERHDIGQVETRIQEYNQALGVVTRLKRPLGAEIECNGICFFPSSSRPVSWRCAPKEVCDLHCDVNPPVGGCR